ncbi:MAG TPA: hypothetical protein VJB68_04795, partial [Methylophilaceae bacterium]|nr:hypothetical protein [Methylophilaceae bacterium]
MSNTQSPKTTRHFRWLFRRLFLGANLAYLLSGKMRLKNGYLPPSGHHIPHDFAGIGVATSADAAADEYVIARLRELGIRQVRLDFTYGDADNHVARFLERLCAESLSVMLHLVQPLYAAKDMHTESARHS